MKSKFILVVLLVCAICSHGQLALRRAAKYKTEFKYTKAIDIYQAYLIKAVDSKVAMVELAECYFRINDADKAIKWYSLSIDEPGIDHKHYMNYAQMLSSTKKYAEAKKWYKKYLEVAGNDKRSERLLAGLENINSLYKDSARYRIENVTFNSPEVDFGPTFFNDGIVFSSARKKHKVDIVVNKPTWNMREYLDLYAFQPSDSSVKSLGKPLNSKVHEGVVSFNEAQTKIYFTRNDFSKRKTGKDQFGVTNLKLYSSTLGVEGWGEAEELSFVNSEYSVGDPFFYEPENVMFFSSNRPGGFGGYDLYKTSFVDGTWTEPINLGIDINSEGDDRSPFYLADGTFLFASNGHAGLGGLDSYHTRIDLATVGGEKVKNWGYPINTSKDDFGLILDNEMKTGFIASNREGGNGQDDIYAVKIVGLPDVKISGVAYVRKENQPVKDRITLHQAIIEVTQTPAREPIKDLVTDKNGAFSVYVEPGYSYTFKGVKGECQPDEMTLKVNQGREKTKDVDLTLVELLPSPTKVLFESTVIDAKTKQPLPDVAVYLFNEKTNQIQYLKSDKQGSFKAYLESSSNYVIKGSKKEYLTNCGKFKTPLPAEKGIGLSKPFTLEKIAVERIFKIENVYFDLDKANIRPDAAKELDKVVTFLKENPTIIVELGSHTDSRATNEYNMELSNRRAASSRDYIVTKGINNIRITSKGYGETQLTNKCSDNVKCSEVEHQANRRTELKITGVKQLAPELVANKLDPGALDPEADHSSCETLKVVEKK